MKENGYQINNRVEVVKVHRKVKGIKGNIGEGRDKVMDWLHKVMGIYMKGNGGRVRSMVKEWRLEEGLSIQDVGRGEELMELLRYRIGRLMHIIYIRMESR